MHSARRHFASLLLISTVAFGPSLALAAEDTHVVQEGETLSGVAGQFGVSVDALVQANGLGDPDKLFPGVVLKLPLAVVRSYTVVPGDTLSAIAQTLGLTVDTLVAANDLSEPDRLAVGMVLKVPGGAATAGGKAQAPRPVQATTSSESAVPVGSVAQAADGSQALRVPVDTPLPRPRRTITAPYVVQVGDTLTAIARQFETTVLALADANGMSDPNSLGVGQTVQVPARTQEHAVLPGETLAAIAAKYTVDLGTMVDYNELADPNLIRAGDLLVVPRVATGAPQAPGGQLVAAAVQPQAPARAPPLPVTQPAAAKPSAPVPAPTPAPWPATQPSSAQPAGTTAAQPSAKPTGQAAPQLPKVTPPSVAPGPPGSQAAIASAAVKLVGKPYAWGGSNESGFDCSGYVWYVAKQAGAPISRGLRGQFDAGPHPDLSSLKPGDLVFFQNTYMPGLSHNGIYLGEGKFIHAADERQGVTVSRMNDAYWTQRFFGATRVGS